MEEQTSSSTPPEKSVPSFNLFQKPLGLVLVIFLLIIIGWAGIYYFRGQLKPESQIEKTQQPGISVSPTPVFDLETTQKPKTQEEFYYQIGQNIKKLFE